MRLDNGAKGVIGPPPEIRTRGKEAGIVCHRQFKPLSGAI